MGSPLWLLPVVLTTTASRPYVGTWQLNDSYTAPPYDRRLVRVVPGFDAGHMPRDVKCRDDNSWRWQWRPAGDAAPLSMMGAAELCATLGGVRVLSLGDSLSHQLVETFRVRRLERDFAVPAWPTSQPRLVSGSPTRARRRVPQHRHHPTAPLDRDAHSFIPRGTHRSHTTPPHNNVDTQGRARHGHHGPGRLLSHRVPAREGLRRPRHHPALVVVQHGADRGPVPGLSLIHI